MSWNIRILAAGFVAAVVGVTACPPAALADIEAYGLSVKSADGVVSAVNLGPADLGVVVALPSGVETVDTSQTWVKTTVPPYSRVTLARIRPMPGGKPEAVNVSVGWRTLPGLLNASPKSDYPYSLPYAPGTEHPVTQAPDKPGFSHRGDHINAIDFGMPEGTPVLAARSGVVVYTVDRYSAGGTSPDMVGKANDVYVEHADGTVAMYSHLRQGGIAVSVGQLVRAGDLLAYSGNTGYSTSPHLHFEVMRLDAAGYNRLDFLALPVKFQVEPGGQGTTVMTGQTLKSVAPGGQVETPTDPHLRAVTEDLPSALAAAPAIPAQEPPVPEAAPAVAAVPDAPAPQMATAPQPAPTSIPEDSGLHLDKGALTVAGFALVWVVFGKLSLSRRARHDD